MHCLERFKLLLVGLVLVLIAWVATLLIEQHRFSVTATDYNSSKGSPVAAGELRKLRAGDIATISCSFLYKGNIGPYDNLFQTDYANSGLRIEISESQGWGIVVSGGDGVLRAFQVPTPSSNGWHDLKIVVYVERQAVNLNDPYKLKKNHVIMYTFDVWLDEMLVARNSMPDLSVSMSNIITGVGFDKERVFNGEIKNFSCSIERTTSLIKINGVYTLLAACLGMVALFLLYKQHRSQSLPSTLNEQAKRYAIFILFCLTTSYVFQSIWPFSFDALRSYVGTLLIVPNWVFGIFALCSAAFFWFFITRDKIFFILIFYVLCTEYFKAFSTRLNGLGFLADTLFIVCLFLFIRYIIKIISHPALRVFLLSIFGFIHFVLFLSLVGGAFYLMQYNLNSFDVHTLNAIFQTTLFESYDFISTQVSILTIAASCIISLCCTILFLILVTHQRAQKAVVAFTKAHVLLIVCFFVGAIITQAFAGVQQSYAYPILRSYERYLSQIEEMQHYAKQREEIQGIEATKEETGETYIVVIGESANKEHLGAYGYFRDTTPWLSQQVQKGNATLFSNAYAVFCHTVPAVLPILTSANQYNGESPFLAPSLFEVLKASGFDTYAIYAQPIDFSVDNPLRVVLDQADETYYPANRTPVASDSTILPVFSTILSSMDKNKNNFIYIELSGSHFDYARRYPPDYSVKFEDTGIEYLGGLHRKTDFIEKVLNPYDTSIHYTDHILSQLYQSAEANINGPVTFIYMSDHGEDVYGEKFHNGGMFTWPMVRVPFAIFFSEDYKIKYPEKVLDIEQAKERIFTLDLFFDTFLNLANVKSKLYGKEYDLAHKDYTIDITNAKTMTEPPRFQKTNYPSLGALDIADDPELIKKQNIEELEKLAPGKFLAIHADAIGFTYDAVRMGFKGIEININVQGERLEMGHGQEWIKQPNTLDEYLSTLPHGSHLKLYIDTKELDPDEIYSFFEQLERLDRKYDLKPRTIIESTIVDPAMAMFSEHGWMVYYYYLYFYYDSTKQLKSGALASDYSEDELIFMPVEQKIEKLLNIIKTQKPTGLSFYYRDYDFIKNHLEPMIDDTIVYSTWSIPEFPSLEDPNMLEKIKEHPVIVDDRIKQVLLPSGSKFYISIEELRP